jgi:GDP-D-mannose dehydratase
MYACTAILANFKSSLLSKQFVTQKTIAAARTNYV